MTVTNNERPCSVCGEPAKFYSKYNEENVLFCSVQCHEKYNEKAEKPNFLLVQLEQDAIPNDPNNTDNNQERDEVVSEIFQACHRGNDNHEKLFSLLGNGEAANQKNEKGQTLMTYSIAKGDMKTLDVLLGAGADVNEANENTMTPLMVAASIEAEQKMEFLLQRGADVGLQDKEGKTALHKTETNKNSQCAKLLLEKEPSLISIKDKFEQTAVHDVAGEGNDVVLIVLLEHEVNLSDTDNLGRTALHCSVIQKAEKCVMLLLDHKEGSQILDIADRFGVSAIHYAVQANNINIVRMLVEKGCDADKKDNNGQTALLSAASCGYTDICKFLLENSKNKNAVDSEGNSALHHAAAQGETEMCELLIQNGVDVDLRDNKQQTCIFRAACNAHTETVKRLLAKGAKCDGSVKDLRGRTPLHHVAQKGDTQVLRELCDHVTKDGGDPEKQTINLRDNNKDSVLYLAASNEHKDCCQLLVDKGAIIDEESRRLLISMGLVEEEKVVEVKEEEAEEEGASPRQRYAADQAPPDDSEKVDDLAIENVTNPEEVANNSRHISEDSKNQSRKSTPRMSTSGSEDDKGKDMLRAKRKNQRQLKARRLNKFAGHQNSPYLQSMLTEDVLHKKMRFLGIRPAYLNRSRTDLESNSSISIDGSDRSSTSSKSSTTHGKKYSYSSGSSTKS